MPGKFHFIGGRDKKVDQFNFSGSKPKVVSAMEMVKNYPEIVATLPLEVQEKIKQQMAKEADQKLKSNDTK